MADEKDIVFSVKINGVDREIKSLQDLKQAKKDATNAFIAGDKEAAKSLALLKDKTEDLADATKSLKGEGVEKLNSSFGLLVDGFKKFDGGQITTAFKGIGSAMKAIPLLLIVEGISYLIEHFDELSKGSGVLAKSLRFVGDALHYISEIIGDVINYFTDMAGATSEATRALEKQGEAIKTNSEKVNEALQSQIKNFDQQIAVAKASGKSTVALEIAKQQAIIDTNKLLAKQIEEYVRAGGELDEEKKKILTSSLEAIRGAVVSQQVVELNDHKERLDKYKAFLDDKKKADEEHRKYVAERKKLDDDADAAATQYLLDQEAKRTEEQNKRDAENQRIKDELQGEIYAGKIKKSEETEKKITADELAAQKGRVQIAKSALDSAQGLSDIFFSIKSAKLKKGSAEEEALAKKQFQINKALQIANATMQGAQAVLSAFSSGAAIPIVGVFAGPAFAAAAGIVAAANIAKIASAQFQSGGGASGGGSPDTGSVGSITSGAPNIPTSEAPTSIAPPKQTTTGLDENGQNLNMMPKKLYVLAADVTEQQQGISTTESRASH